MNGITAPDFPCASLPADGTACRLLGLYPQRQEGLWMQRIKIHGGDLSSRQWSSLAEICRKHSPETPMHLTTRQDIEFHNLSGSAVPALQKDLRDLGFTGLGACGDTLRNITLCPGSGLCRNTLDLGEAAGAVREVLENYSNIYSLPRKFKISFSACEKSCAQPWINDLGFVAVGQGGRACLKVIGAGSLGARPCPGILLHENLPVSDAPAFALAAVQLFNAHGDRKVRGKARLRHVRERLGNGRFLSLLHKQFESCAGRDLPKPSAGPVQKEYALAAELGFPEGALTPEHAQALAELTADTRTVARLQNHHRLSLLSGLIESTLKTVGADRHLKPLLGGPDVASCPGTDYCKHALVNTRSVERALRGLETLPVNRPIRISGCPNGCAHSAVADIGLSGMIRKDEHGNRVEGFRVVSGGGMGRTEKPAGLHLKFVSSAQAPPLVLKLLQKGAL